MAQDIHDTFPVAKQVFEEAEEALGIGLKNIMFNGPQARRELNPSERGGESGRSHYTSI